MPIQPPNTPRPTILRRFGPIALAIIREKSVSGIGVDDDLDSGVMWFQQCFECADILRCRVFILLSEQAEEGTGDILRHIEAADRLGVVLILSPWRTVPSYGGAELLVIGGILHGGAAAPANTGDPDPFGKRR
jgi:hypothetical protein